MIKEKSSTQVANKGPVQAAWWGVVVLFLAHGLVVSSWLSRIPAVQRALHLNNGILGLTLLSAALGAVTTIQISGYLVSRFGSRIVSILSSIALCCSVILPGLAWNALTLAVALFVYGAMAAAMDVSMNAQGVEVEKRLGQPTMSRFHAMFSLGAMAGAALGGTAATHGIAPLPHLVGSCLFNIAAVLAIARTLIREPEQSNNAEEQHRLPLRGIPPVLLALSAIGFCILLSEGAIADWAAIYLQQVLGAGQGMAAAGYSVFSAAMAVFRLLGDLITARLGALRTVRDACLVAAAGVLCALAAPSSWWALPGFAVAGIGLSVIIPLVFGAGGRIPGVSSGAGIATVSGLGYIGFIVGPPTIGFASQVLTLRYGLGVVVVCCLIGAWLARFMRDVEAASPQQL